MDELTVTRWRRYGKDRLYVSTADGTRVGWVDLVTGDRVVQMPQHNAEFDRAIAAQLHRLQRDRAAADETASAAPSHHSMPSSGSEVTHAAAGPSIAEPHAVTVDWTDLAANQPGQAAREQAIAHRQAAPVKTLVQRAFGVRSDERAWRIGADGEQRVAAVLARLPETWKALHAVPVGTRGSDIDHVVIGPGGVFTINTKHHPGAVVWVGGNTFLVNGQRQSYVRNARHEAQRACTLLSAAAGFPVPVTGVIAVICTDLTVRTQPDDVRVLGRKRLDAWLTKQPPVLTAEQVATILSVARRSSTWQ